MASIIFYREFSPHIYIDYSLYHLFNGGVNSDLSQIKATPTGERLLQKIAHKTHAIYITHGPYDLILAHDAINASLPSKGSSCTIFYSGENKKLSYCPSRIRLAHELIHAYHVVTGKCLAGHTRAPFYWPDDEEYKTIVGFATKKKERLYPKITENTIRDELGLPRRVCYEDDGYYLFVGKNITCPVE